MNNLLRGFVTRVWRYKGRDPVAPNVTYVKSATRKFLTAYKGYPVQPLGYDAVLERTLPRRRKIYLTAIESLHVKPVCKTDSYVSTFIKAEKFNYTAKPDADPRLIQPRGARFLAAHAQYIKAVELPIYKCLGRLQRHPMVAKGFNAEETARILREKWDMFRDPVCVSLDASRFDQHVSIPMLQFCHAVYRRHLRRSMNAWQHLEFERLCNWQLRNKGFARCFDGSFQYEVEGRRMSGDMDTALGNCVIMCMMTWELLRMVGKKGQIFNNGDDCLIIMERHDVPEANLIRDHYLQFGFHVVEEDRIDVFERIQFCQTSPVWADRWVMCRDPMVINKDLTYIGPESSFNLWINAIGQCGLALADGVPVLSTFYRNLIRPVHASGIENSMLYSCGMTRLAARMSFRGRCITEEARLSFERAFGVSPEDQVAIESSMGPLGKLQHEEYCEHVTLLDYIYGQKKKNATAAPETAACPAKCRPWGSC